MIIMLEYHSSLALNMARNLFVFAILSLQGRGDKRAIMQVISQEMEDQYFAQYLLRSKRSEPHETFQE